MSHDPTGLDGYDQRLVDYVYGELSAARELQVEERLERDPDARAEVDSLRAVRAAFSEMPDAEPSPKITYDILREARVAAADRAASPKPLFGLAMPKLLMHPAFASVCVLVLMSGAILVLQKTGADRPTKAVAADEELGVFADKPAEAVADAPAALDGLRAPAGAVVSPPAPEPDLANGRGVEQEAAPRAALATRELKSAKPAKQMKSDRRTKTVAKPKLAERKLQAPATPAKRGDKADLSRALALRPPSTPQARGVWGGGGSGAAKDELGDMGASAPGAPAPIAAAERQVSGEAMDMDELLAADASDSFSMGSAGNVATQRSAPAALPAQTYGYKAGGEALGGVRGGARRQDLGSRELKLRIGDLDRLPANRAWGDSLGVVARSTQRSTGVDRVRRKLLAMDFKARAAYARLIKDEIRSLQSQGHLQAAAELKSLLEHIELEGAKESSVEEEGVVGPSDDGDAEEAAEMETLRDEKAAPEAEEYRQVDRSKRKMNKAKVRLLKKSRAAPAEVDAVEADKADDQPASTAF